MFSSWFSRISVDEQVQEESRLTGSLFSPAERKDFPSLSSISSLTCVLTRRQELCDSNEQVGLDGRESEASPSVCLSVWAKAPQSVEKRSPAEGSGARPPVTLGRRERSGRLWMWDLSSFLTWVTRASFCLYSCRHQTKSVCGDVYTFPARTRV